MRPRIESNPIGIDKREDIYSVTSRRRYDDYRAEKSEPTVDEEVEEKLTQQTSYQGESPVCLILCYASPPPSSTSSNIFLFYRRFLSFSIAVCNMDDTSTTPSAKFVELREH